MKYKITAKDKAAVYYLLKRLSTHLELSAKMLQRMRTLRLRFSPGPGAIEIIPRDRDSLLKILIPVFKIMKNRKFRKDDELRMKLERVVFALLEARLNQKAKANVA